MATTSGLTREGGGGEDDRVMATAQKIVNSLNTSKNAREDMLLILSSFDNRLSNLSYVIKTGSESQSSILDSAEKIILRSDSGMSSNAEAFSWYDSAGEAGDYLDAVDKILDLLDNLSVGPDPEVLDRAETVLQVAMSRLEEEFGHILIRNTVPLDAERLYGSIRRVSLSFAANEGEIDEEFASFEEVESGSVCFHERGGSLGDDLCVDLINSEAVMYLKDIADRMIRAGYEKECVQVYSSVRRDALDDCLAILGVEKLSIEEVQRIDWKSLDEKMKKWVRAVKAGDRVLLRGERRLCDVIFSGSDSAREVCFNETAKGFLMQLLNFAEAVSIGRRSPEKLFRILDMYDALSGVFPDLEAMVTDEFVYSEAKGVLAGLGRAAKGTFVVFENAVKSETSRKPMLGGVIHPLTRYVMNYVKLLVDYSDTLNSLLENDEDELDGLQIDDSERLQLESLSPIARRLLALLSTLESNLEEKSTLYEDGAMRYIFRMNNILYMVQKVKDSELIKILGDQWVRNHRGQIRRYATAYLRAAWSKALSCLKDEGIGGGSNNASSKVALKERFKSFNACFEEIYRIQTGWKVPDPQLREELRISISENVLPAYRSFTGRFGSQIDSGRHAGKYVKYSPDDLENYLIDLFEGTPLVLHHLRRKNSS
ncbi:EXOCYST COMPLEX PROTEIN EXO70 [Salix purpurea]|uniref:Exocyst subunit Exo70 family protein n=1 Tax=Salix purpurea TaxID=77065 RepID=A0A9Q0VJ13_SALPP|nr:EXOCYST COMPLEX PROTEIN EXO70 [Salix purpurea]KAJ6748418.1 EXOCYST COMPLEX PROTEIN EXO70 [Salix purpurea]